MTITRFVAIATVVAASALTACGGTTVTDATTTTTGAASSSTTSTTTDVPDTTPTTAPVAETTTTPPTTSAPPPEEGVAWFAISEVIFGDAGRIVIENIGTATGAIDGYWLCQRPGYFEIPAATLAPGERLAVFVGSVEVPEAGFSATSFAGLALGSFTPDDGEIALYSSNSFSSSAAIVDYVEWGRAGHGRSAVAVEAGLWVEGEFLDVPPDALGITAAATTTTRSVADWSIEVGG